MCSVTKGVKGDWAILTAEVTMNRNDRIKFMKKSVAFVEHVSYNNRAQRK